MSPASRNRKKKRHTTKRVPHKHTTTMYPLEDDPEGSPADIERRRFAMPYGGTRVGGTDYRFLDPADEDDRRLLIIGEHPPAYHALWTNPHEIEELGGTNPRLHITMDEIVINQLWDDTPPEVWAAAQRLTNAGRGRWDVIHKIAELLVRHMHPVLTRNEPFNEPAYRTDLDALS